MLFTPRSAVSAHNPGTSRKAFFRAKQSAVPVPKAKGDGETENNAAPPGAEAKGEQSAPQQQQQPAAQDTFFKGKNGGGGDAFFAPKTVVAKPAAPAKPTAPAPEKKQPEQEQQQTEQETAPLVENEAPRPGVATPPADPPVDPVPAGAHLLFNPEQKKDTQSDTQAESGHKSDIKRQMEMETQDARNNLGLDPKSEEGKPTVFEPKNPGEKQGGPIQLEQKGSSAPAVQPGGAAQQPPEQGKTGEVPKAAPEPAAGAGGKAAGGNLEPEASPQQAAPEANALPAVDNGNAVAQIGSLNAVEPTEAELENYLKDPRSDAEKRQQQAGLAASFAQEAAAAEVRINASVTTNRATILAAQSQASEALVAQIAAVTARMQAHFAGERQSLAVQMTTVRKQLAASKAADLAAADALQLEKTTTLTTELSSRRDAFNQFVAEQKQQPYVKAAAEADRADGELNAAAATCRQQGNEIAARHNGSDDGDPEARESVLRVARESAEDILSKKATIREDVMGRAADFDGSFGQYQEDTVNQINDIEHQLVPGIAEAITAYKQQIETAYSGIETSLAGIEQSRLSQLDQQEQSTMEGLRTLQQNGLHALEEAAYGSVHALELAGQQTLDAAQEMGQQIHTLLTPGEGLPDLVAIQSLYDESLAQLQQLEADGTANMQLLVDGAQTQFDGISSQSTQESDAIATRATTTTASMLTENEAQLTQINTNVVQSMASAAAAITTSLDQMRSEALAGLDQSIEERKGKITQANDQFGTELHSQVNTSIETAKQPLLDVLIDRLLSASYKAKASWWEGLLLAIADFLLVLIVIVAIAAVLVYFGVFATIAGALMVIGAVVLAIVFIVSLVSRLASGQGWKGFFYAIFDTIGVTAIYQAITNRDIATGRDLGQNTFDRWFSGTSGVLQLITILSPLKSRIPGIRRITFPELPGWARFAEWVEGAGAGRRNGAPALWDQFTGKLGRIYDRILGRTPKPEEQPGDQPGQNPPKDPEQKPAEEKPAEEKPTEEKPSEEKPKDKKTEYDEKVAQAKAKIQEAIGKMRTRLDTLKIRWDEAAAKKGARFENARRNGAEVRDPDLRNLLDAETKMNGLRERLNNAERELGEATSENQVNKIEQKIKDIEAEIDQLENLHFGMHGMSKEASDAIKLLEQLKHDPVGEVNSEPNKNHYGAARLEARNGMLMKDGKPVLKSDGTPYSHIRDLQNAYDALGNVKKTLEAEVQSPSQSMTERGTDILLEKLIETNALIARLRGFLQEIGWPPERPHRWEKVDGEWRGTGDMTVLKPRTIQSVRDVLGKIGDSTRKAQRVIDPGRRGTLVQRGQDLQRGLEALRTRAENATNEPQLQQINEELRPLNNDVDNWKGQVEGEERY